MAPSIGPGQGDANAPAMPWGQAMVRSSGRCHDLEKFAFLSPGMPRFGGSHRGGDPALRWFAASGPRTVPSGTFAAGFAHGIFSPAAHQRTDARLDLRPDRHRLYDGLRHHRHDQFRPWRRVHGRRLPGAHRLPDAGCAGRHRGAAGVVPGVADRDGADAGVFLASREHAAGTRHARLRAGSQDGVAGRSRHRSHHLAHLRDRRGARRRRRHHGPALLRRDRFLHRLRRRRKSVHGGGARRHRLATRRDGRRPAHRADRDVLVGVFLDRVQGRRRLLGPGDRADLPADRHSGPPGNRESLRGSRIIRVKPVLDLRAALKNAVVAAATAFGLFALLIGIRTDQGPSGGLELTPRFGTLGILVAIAFVGGLLRGILFGERRIHIAPRLPAAATAVLDRVGRMFAPALLAFALAVPILFYHDRYILDLSIQILTYVMLGWGLNIVVGLAGLLDLGYVAFYAVGAYSYALIATNFGLSFWMCLPVSGILACFWGILLGFPVLRLRGDYLAIVTLAFGEIIRLVLINWQSVTGGPNGVPGIPRPSFFGIPFNAEEGGFAATFGLEFSPTQRIVFLFYVILALALLTNWVTIRLRRLPIGRAWEALREDEIACRSLGINTTNVKLTAFAMGAMFGGFAGSFFATRQGFISPESLSFVESALVLAIVVLGGMGSQLGVVIAAVVMLGGFELFREFAQYRMLVFGFAMVAIMVWRPRGLIATRSPSVFLRERESGRASCRERVRR